MGCIKFKKSNFIPDVGMYRDVNIIIRSSDLDFILKHVVVDRVKGKGSLLPRSYWKVADG